MSSTTTSTGSLLSVGLSYSCWDQAFIAIVDDSHAQCHAAPKAAKTTTMNDSRVTATIADMLVITYPYGTQTPSDWKGREYRVYLRR